MEDRLADVVVGNPPYVRYDDLPEDVAAEYRRIWSTMRGRVDIYVGFIERSLRMLGPEGKVGFICADRWMRNQYGSTLRELIGKRYAVEHVWTMHDVDAFQEQVSAYPAITVLANRCASAAAALVKAVNDKSFTNFVDIGVTAHRLPHWFDGAQLLQDMKVRIHPVLEPGGHYPHHNIYYVVSDTWDMEVLGGLLLSRIAQAFIEAYCVRMRGGTLRFQAQYLKRIRVPEPATLDQSTRDALRRAFRRRDVDAATRAAATAYDIDLRDYDVALDDFTAD
ncbi:Eco57I restriction-modification methylase domain-containing protein [Spirillospora sp. NBC_00431]